MTTNTSGQRELFPPTLTAMEASLGPGAAASASQLAEGAGGEQYLQSIPPVVVEWLQGTRMWTDYVVDPLRERFEMAWTRKQRRLRRNPATGSTGSGNLQLMGESGSLLGASASTATSTHLAAKEGRSQLDTSLIGSVTPQDPGAMTAANTTPMLPPVQHGGVGFSKRTSAFASGLAQISVKSSYAHSTHSGGSPRRPNSSSLDVTLNGGMASELMSAITAAGGALPSANVPLLVASVDQSSTNPQPIQRAVPPRSPTQQHMPFGEEDGVVTFGTPTDGNNPLAEGSSSAGLPPLSVDGGSITNSNATLAPASVAKTPPCPAISEEDLIADAHPDLISDLLLTAVYAGPLIADAVGFDWRSETTSPSAVPPSPAHSHSQCASSPSSSYRAGSRSPRSMRYGRLNSSHSPAGAESDPPPPAVIYTPPFAPNASVKVAVDALSAQGGGLARSALWQHIAACIYKCGVEVNMLGFKQILVGYREALVEMLILIFKLHTDPGVHMNGPQRGRQRAFAVDPQMPVLGHEDPTELAQVLLSSAPTLHETLLASAVTIEEYMRRLRVITAHKHHQAAHQASRRPSLDPTIAGAAAAGSSSGGSTPLPQPADNDSAVEPSSPGAEVVLTNPEGAIDPASVLASVSLSRDRRRASSCEPILTAHQCQMVVAFGPTTATVSGGPTLSTVEHNHLVLKELVKKSMPASHNRRRSASPEVHHRHGGGGGASARSLSIGEDSDGPISTLMKASHNGYNASCSSTTFSGFGGIKRTVKSSGGATFTITAGELDEESDGDEDIDPREAPLPSEDGGDASASTMASSMSPTLTPGTYFDGRYSNFSVFRAVASMVVLEQLKDPSTRFQCQFAAAVVLKDVCLSFGFPKVFYWLVLNPTNDALIKQIQDGYVKVLMDPATNADIHDFLLYLLVAISSPDRLVVLIEKMFQPRLNTRELIQLSAMLLQVPGESVHNAVRWMIFLCASVIDPAMPHGDGTWLPADVASAQNRTQGLQHVSWRHLAKGEAGVTEYLPPPGSPAARRSTDSRSESGSPVGGQRAASEKGAPHHNGNLTVSLDSRGGLPTPNSMHYKYQMRRDRDDILGTSGRLDSQGGTSEREGSTAHLPAIMGGQTNYNGTMGSMVFSDTFGGSGGMRHLAHRLSLNALANFQNSIAADPDLYAEALCLMLHIFADFYGSEEGDLGALVEMMAPDVVGFLQTDGQHLLASHPSIVMELMGAAFTAPDVFMAVFAEAAASDEIFGDDDLRMDLLECISAMLYSFPTADIAPLAEAFLLLGFAPQLAGPRPNEAMVSDVECMFLQELSASLHTYHLRHENQDGQLSAVADDAKAVLLAFEGIRHKPHTCAAKGARAHSPPRYVHRQASSPSPRSDASTLLPIVTVTPQLIAAKRITRQLATIAATQLGIVVRQNVNGERDMVVLADFAEDEEGALRLMSARREKAHQHQHHALTPYSPLSRDSESPTGSAVGEGSPTLPTNANSPSAAPYVRDAVRDIQIVLRRAIGRYVSDLQHTDWALSLFAQTLCGRSLLGDEGEVAAAMLLEIEEDASASSAALLSVFPFRAAEAHGGFVLKRRDGDGAATATAASHGEASPTLSLQVPSEGGTSNESMSPIEESSPPSRAAAPLPMFPSTLPKPLGAKQVVSSSNSNAADSPTSPVPTKSAAATAAAALLVAAEGDVPFMGIVQRLLSNDLNALLGISHASCACVGLMYRTIQHTVRAAEVMLLVKHAAVGLMLLEWRRAAKQTASSTASASPISPGAFTAEVMGADHAVARKSFVRAFSEAFADSEQLNGVTLGLGGGDGAESAHKGGSGAPTSTSLALAGERANSIFGATATSVSVFPNISISQAGGPNAAQSAIEMLSAMEEEQRLGVALRSVLWLCQQMGITLPTAEDVSDAMLARVKEAKAARAAKKSKVPQANGGKAAADSAEPCEQCAAERKTMFGCLVSFLPIAPRRPPQSSGEKHSAPSNDAKALSREWRDHLYISFADQQHSSPADGKRGGGGVYRQSKQPPPISLYPSMLRQDVSEERRRYAGLIHHHGFGEDEGEGSFFAVPETSTSALSSPHLNNASQQQQTTHSTSAKGTGILVTVLPLDKVKHHGSQQQKLPAQQQHGKDSSSASARRGNTTSKTSSPAAKPLTSNTRRGIAALALPLTPTAEPKQKQKEKNSNAKRAVPATTTSRSQSPAAKAPASPAQSSRKTTQSATSPTTTKVVTIAEDDPAPSPNTRKSVAKQQRAATERKMMERWVRTAIVEPLLGKAMTIAARHGRQVSVVGGSPAAKNRQQQLSSLRRVQQRQHEEKKQSSSPSKREGDKSSAAVAPSRRGLGAAGPSKAALAKAERDEHQRRKHIFTQQLAAFIGIVKVHQQDAKAAADQWLESLARNAQLLQSIALETAAGPSPLGSASASNTTPTTGRQNLTSVSGRSVEDGRLSPQRVDTQETSANSMTFTSDSGGEGAAAANGGDRDQQQQRECTPSFGPTVHTVRAAYDASLSARSIGPMRRQLPLARYGRAHHHESSSQPGASQRQKDVQRQRRAFMEGQRQILENFSQQQASEEGGGGRIKSETEVGRQQRLLSPAEVDIIPIHPTAASRRKQQGTKQQGASTTSPLVIAHDTPPREGGVDDHSRGGSVSEGGVDNEEGFTSGDYATTTAETSVTFTSGGNTAFTGTPSVVTSGGTSPSAAPTLSQPSRVTAHQQPSAALKPIVRAPQKHDPTAASSAAAASNSAPPQAARGYRGGVGLAPVAPAAVRPTKIQLKGVGGGARALTPASTAVHHHLQPLGAPGDGLVDKRTLSNSALGMTAASNHNNARGVADAFSKVILAPSATSDPAPSQGNVRSTYPIPSARKAPGSGKPADDLAPRGKAGPRR